MNVIRISSNLIIDEETFHSVFSDAFGFPNFYGGNMNAWIDCMGYLDEPAEKMTSVHVASGESLALVIDDAFSFKSRCPALYDALVECSAFVNWRCVEAGRAVVTMGIGAFFIGLVWAFMYNKYYTRRLLERGYVLAGSEGDNALAASALGIVLPAIVA